MTETRVLREHAPVTEKERRKRREKDLHALRKTFRTLTLKEESAVQNAAYRI